LAQSSNARHRLRRVVLAALVAVLAATLFTVPSATASPPPTSGTGSAAVPRLDWGSCAAEGEGLEAFQCATAVVPLDYDRPKGRQITVALARLPAADPSRKIGSLFLNPGGPGGSGVDFLLGAGPFLYSDEVRARFDLVGFDPRGIIRSTPLRCFDSLEEAEAAFFTPFQFPVTRAEERLWIQTDRAVARACAERGGPILDHMSTANVARDMDLLRRAVGDAKLTYAGYSYGSYLGSTYANLFPTKVRALVVDGVLDPVAWSTGRGDQASTLLLPGQPPAALRPAGQAAAPRPRRVRRPRVRRDDPGHLRRADRDHPRRAVRPGRLGRVGRGPPAAGRADQPQDGRGRPQGPAGPPRGGVPAGGLPQLRRGVPRGRLLRDPQPVQRRRLVAGGAGPGPPVPLLRPALDLGQQHL
jgi:pimeloyl-ACP methyl ester carboxylesterase